nr:RNA-directed DNA polymerase, eukaryota [Tanacetum cinerariifolium]
MNKKGGFILEVLDDMIKVGQTMGFSMEGCMKDMEDIIGSQGVHDATKMSKLDRFLVTEGLVSLFPHTSGICLDRHLSDHQLILLREKRDGLFQKEDAIFKKGDSDQGGVNDEIILSRMDLLKQMQDIKSFDARDYQGGVNDEILLSRMDLLKQLQDIKSSDARDCMQKAKIQWAIEGDENFKFSMVAELENPITRDEIRNAVWACGENKSPGQTGLLLNFSGCNSSFVALIPKTHDPNFVSDYWPISLIGSLYKVVTKILATRLSMVISDLILDVQTAFLPNRQILDGPFIINELLSWCKHKKQQTMVFKVDFAKAYDSIRWDYLDVVLRSFGFGSKWCSWISGSLILRMASILINGSPTYEFQFHCGLKHGDLLAHYLFILIMESLHLSFSRAVDAGIFTGIKIDSSLTISHLFYADDAVFIGSTPIYNMSLYKVPKSVLHLMESIRRNFFNGIQGDERKITRVKWSK